MSTKEIYKRVLLTNSKGINETALITGLNWIKNNLRKELKLVPIDYEEIVQNKILSIKYPELSYLLKQDIVKLNDKDNLVIQVMIKICYLNPTENDSVDQLCEIISTIRKNSEEQAILRDFKLL